MASKEALQVGIRIGATDEASGVIAGMVNKANSSMNSLVGGLVSMGVGRDMFNGLKVASNEFGEQQYAFSKLRILEMNKVGEVNERVFGDEQSFIRGLSGTYAKTTDDYTKMVTVLRQNRISPEDILGGVGESNAKLAKAFDNLDPDKAALFFARLKNDMRVSASDMDQLANTAYKMFNLGVGGGDANKGVEEITEFFSKASLGAVNLGLTGKEAAKEMTLLGSVFLNKGLSGTSVGTNFRRIFDGLTDPKRMGKVAARGLELGVKLSFFDEHGKFKGLRNFEDQLDKLRGKTPQQINYVLQPFSGKQGLSIDFLEYLSQWGSGDIEQLRKRTNEMANLDDAVKELVDTQKIQNDKTESARKNMAAAFGKSMSADVQRLNHLLQGTYEGLQHIAEENPHLTTFTSEFVGASSAALILYGGLRAVGGYIPTVAKLAAGLGTVLSRMVPFLFGLMGAKAILESFGDTSAAKEKQLAANPNTEKSKLIRGYDEIINDPDKSWLKRYLAKKVQDGIVRNTQLFGDHSEGSNNPGPTDKIWKGYNEQMPGRYPSNASMITGTNYSNQPQTQPFVYAPVINTAGDTLTEDKLQEIMKLNADDLVKRIEREQTRKRNLTYGEK